MANNGTPAPPPRGVPRKGMAAHIELPSVDGQTAMYQVFVGEDGGVQVSILIMNAHFHESGVFDKLELDPNFDRAFAQLMHEQATRVLKHLKDEEPRIIVVGG